MALIVSDNAKKKYVNRGKLIRVMLSLGRFVKMYERDAIEQGLIDKPSEPVEKKKIVKEITENKIIKPQETKIETGFETKELVDDFTIIDGIGPAGDRVIKANGITTFEQLKSADISFLSQRGQESIEAWRNG